MATRLDPFQRAQRAANFQWTGRSAFTENGGEFFGPQTPIAPQAPADVKGRIYDYPSGLNIAFEPRQYQRIGFERLRAVAGPEGWGLLRAVIETAKDQVVRQKWTIGPKDIGQGGAPKARSDDPRMKELITFFKRPARGLTWRQWLHKIMDDLLVIDAPTLYLHRNRGGGVYQVEVIDGATIKPLSMPDGRMPLAPLPAYQQILKGVPAVNYTTEEMIYMPRNVRTHTDYGFSPVEQIIRTIEMAIERQKSQYYYFSDGSDVPSVMWLPETWSLDQIKAFDDYWQSISNLQTRRRVRFVPGGGGSKLQEMKSPPLKDEFDEWLARVVCFAFSISPTPFIGQNRSAADTSAESAQEEGLEPRKMWVKDLIDEIISKWFGYTDLEFMWLPERSIDPKIQAEIDINQVNAGLKSRNQVRAEYGDPPDPHGDDLTVTVGDAVYPMFDVAAPVVTSS